ncbi:hypothetical protein GCM10017786_69390 [Amycolatopsis deserti]|uniref:Glycosyltransferase RgtA/B/C/D-like domain-containing protein n=1 Tax=Amycolatopsis deserti TaxID=185696 RepID=A0ABQ3JF67_9PSEU|nr:hypothetical protein GCM10017786_69390 [Amycolatopsis deserti]
MAVSLAHQMLFYTVTEDAFITYRYALNLAEGRGLVFNPGERVEGYSNFLWTVVVAIPQAIAGRGIMAVSIALGMACTVGCVVLAYLLTNRIVASAGSKSRAEVGRFGLLAAALTAVAGSLAAYASSGMESSLFTLLVLATCFAVFTDHHFTAGVLAALGTMTRPDGALVAVVVLGSLLAGRGDRVSRPRPVVLYTAGVLVLAVPWTVWRLLYYGHLLPNTLAAKSGGALGWQLSEGLKYFADFGLAHHGLLLVAVAGATVLALHGKAGPAASSKPARHAVWLLFTIAVAYTLFVVYVGGDYMAAWRFFAPVPPLLATATASATGIVLAGRATDRQDLEVRPTHQDAHRGLPLVTATLCLMSLLISVMAPRMAPLIHTGGRYTAALAEIGDWFHARLEPGTVISTVANGAISYNAGPEIVVVDALGLTDEHIGRQGTKDNPIHVAGHISNDWEYVVNERRPSLVIVTGRGYATSQPCAVDARYAGAFRHWVENGSYRTATFRRDGQQNWVVVYLRSDRFPDLRAALDGDPRFTYVPCPGQ